MKEQSSHNILLEYFVPISESAEIDGDFTIQGIAINETTTSNGHKFIGEELSKSAKTLINVPLLKDHENRVDNIVGRVKSAFFDESSKSIPFKAIVKDTKMKQMVKDGLINSVSVGAHVDPRDIEELEDGSIVPHNITFKELSLVAIPADAGATFSVALNNALKLESNSRSETDKNERGSKQMVEEQENEQPQVEEPKEPKEEVKAEAEEAEAEPKQEEPKEDVTEKLLKKIEELESKIDAMKESDADESKEEKEEPKEKPKESEESEDEEEEVEEKAAYKIVAGHKSFSVVRDNYRQRLIA